MCYNMTSYVGKNSEAICQKIMNVIVELMENTDDEATPVDLQSFLRRKGIEYV